MFTFRSVQVVDREIKELKLQLNTRLRAASASILQAQMAPKASGMELETTAEDLR